MAERLAGVFPDFKRLVAHHGWSSDDYEEWLAVALRGYIRDSTLALGQEVRR